MSKQSLDEILNSYNAKANAHIGNQAMQWKLQDEAKAKLSALLRRVEMEAKMEQTVHLQVAEQKFGKVDWGAAIYELEPRDKWGSE